MQKCEECGKEIQFPFTCNYCHKTFCPEHRLPENHQCPMLPNNSEFWYKKRRLDNLEQKDGICPKCGSPSSEMTDYDAKTMTFRCKECGDNFTQSKAIPYEYVDSEDKMEYSEKPKTAKPFPTKKVVGILLIVVIIGAFAWYSPTIISAFQNLSSQLNSTLSGPSYTHEELVNYTLALINSDRNGFVINPYGATDVWVPTTGEKYPQNVSLSSVDSAQQHADSMLENHYFSHWDTNGYKPYMRYTLAGGSGSVAENIAWYSTSGSFDAKEAIESLEWQMMENDSQWNWAHKDNILNSFHNEVNLGISYDGHNLYLVEDFENDYIAWSTFTHSSGEIIMDGTIIKSGLSISDVAIYYDQIANLTTQQLEDAPYNGSYDQGTFVGLAVPSGWTSSQGITITAKTWAQTGQSFQIDFALSPAFAQYGKGVYTLYLTTTSSNFLTSYSIWN